MLLPDASAFGAALAAIAGCTNTNLAAIAEASVHPSSQIEPKNALRRIYDAGFERYLEIADQYIQALGKDERAEP